MQRYIQVLEGTVRAQYESAYARLQERRESDEDEVISLLDFAAMNGNDPLTLSVSAA
jgi:hypothetical protein